MNLLVEIDGKRGEILISSVIRYLVLNSIEVRQALIQIISDNSNIGPISAVSSFSCETEKHSTSDEKYGGFIDILIRTDDAVIGIENKIHADFQEDQPQKYLSYLKRIQENEGEYDLCPVLPVLAPNYRKNEVLGIIKDDKNCCFISWEELINKLKDVSGDCSDKISLLLSIFIEYMDQYIGFYPGFEKIVPHINRLEIGGSIHQKRLVGSVASIFPDVSSRMGVGKDTQGYSFLVSQSSSQQINAWFGFVNSQKWLNGEEQGKTEFIVATNFDDGILDEVAQDMNLKKIFFKNKLWQMYSNVWIVPLDKSWSRPDKWHDLAKPFHNFGKRLVPIGAE